LNFWFLIYVAVGILEQIQDRDALRADLLAPAAAYADFIEVGKLL